MHALTDRCAASVQPVLTLSDMLKATDNLVFFGLGTAPMASILSVSPASLCASSSDSLKLYFRFSQRLTFSASGILDILLFLGTQSRTSISFAWESQPLLFREPDKIASFFKNSINIINGHPEFAIASPYT